jgi:hypothetical protein
VLGIDWRMLSIRPSRKSPIALPVLLAPMAMPPTPRLCESDSTSS